MEPDIYDSIALVHVRSLRVILAVPHVDGMGRLIGDGFHSKDSSESMDMHCLPGTDHHYWVLRVRLDHPSSTYFYSKAAKLHSN